MWWLWTIVWVVLALGALAFLGLLGWGVVKKVIALGRTAGEAADRVGEAMRPVRADVRAEPSVLVDPSGADRARPPRS